MATKTRRTGQTVRSAAMKNEKSKEGKRPGKKTGRKESVADGCDPRMCKVELIARRRKGRKLVRYRMGDKGQLYVAKQARMMTGLSVQEQRQRDDERPSNMSISVCVCKSGRVVVGQNRVQYKHRGNGQEERESP